MAEPAREAIASRDSELWLSPVSVWEVVVLAEKNRLRLAHGAGEWIERALRELPTREAALTFEVAQETRRVRLPHADAADRFLAATARVYGLLLVTADHRLLDAPDVPALR